MKILSLFNGLGGTQTYKMLGNGWQIDTIEHIWKTCTLFEVKS